MSALLLVHDAKSGLLDISLRIQRAFATLFVVFVPFLIFTHYGGGMDCGTASYAEVVGSSPSKKEQKFVPSIIPLITI